MAGLESQTARDARRPSISSQSIIELEEYVNPDSISFDEVSSEEDEQTRARVRRPGQKPELIGVPFTSVGTTENDNAPIYFKPFGDQRKPRYDDVEAGLSTSTAPVPPAVTPAIPSPVPERNLHIYEILHNWTKGSQDELLIPTISVLKRPAAEAHQIRGHVGWL
jgi:hypothetical protein